MTRTNRRFALLGFAAAGLSTICLVGTALSQGTRTGAHEEDSYFPLSVGNWWLYKCSGHSQLAGKTQRWTVTDKAVHEASPDYYLSPRPSLGQDSPLVLSRLRDGIVEAGDRFLLKYPIRIGNRWSSKSNMYGAEGELDVFEVVSAGRPCLVGTRSFDDCVTVRETDEGASLFLLTTYARGVGPVKYVYFEDVHFRAIESTLTIESWAVP
jgi:hypothetical protein